jgi:nicotinamidase/pyrazinamidase
MKTVFIDVDSQLDFVYPAGALYVPGAERILPAIAALNRFAAAHGMPVISTTDAHAENDPEFKQWPAHCVAGTWGQRKPEATLLDRRVVIPNRECPIEVAPQIVVEKQTVDAFQVRNFSRAIEALQAEAFVVYGVVTEVCVLHAARGLLKLGKPVTIVTDAIKELSEAGARSAFTEICANGAILKTTGEVCI